MTDFTRRTLRTWAVGCALHGVVIAVLVIWLVPWKTPPANVALLAYAALPLAAAPGLWRTTRRGWWLALVAALVGLVAAVALIGGLLLSWAYLRTVYGELGTGASVGALLMASVVFQLLGTVPALLLRALLRREVRADLGIRKKLPRAAALPLLVLPLIAFIALIAVGARLGLSPLPPLPEPARAHALAVLRAALEQKERPTTADLDGVPLAGPLYVTLWRRGTPVARVMGEGKDLAAAVNAAADALADKARHGLAVDGRLKIDRVVAVGAVFSRPPILLAFAINPGLDGLRRDGADLANALLPDDLIRADVFGSAAPLASSQELRAGLDTTWALAHLGSGQGSIERFRTEGWIEHEGGQLAVVRGNTPSVHGSAVWRTAAIEGGDYMLFQQNLDGTFRYQYFPFTNGTAGNSETSLPRHAGAAYALSQLAGATHEERFRVGAQKALAWLEAAHVEPCGENRLCVLRGERAELGDSAIALVAMLEYRRQTGDARFDATARGLGELLLSMQRPDGELNHRLYPATGQVDANARVMFASEQAALAFVLCFRVFGEERYLTAAQRALDHITGPRYGLLGRFIYGAEHWACIAADEAFPRLNAPAYLEFCRGYCRFIERMQYEPGAWTNDDHVGHYGFSSVFQPQPAATAGFSEAVVSTFKLSAAHHMPDARVQKQLALGLDALVRDQLRPDNSFMFPRPDVAKGGLRRSLVQSEIRLDFTQHAVSALLRGSMLADRGGDH